MLLENIIVCLYLLVIFTIFLSLLRESIKNMHDFKNILN
jgi:hypothetical protein